MPNRPPLYPRFAERRLTEALADSPAVLIHGPRQCGKTTLAQTVGTRAGYTYMTFDDEVTRGVATADPVGFVARLTAKSILDEVQRVPEIFTSLKAAIDARTDFDRLHGQAPQVLSLPVAIRWRGAGA